MTHEQAPLDLVEGDRLLAAFKRSQPKYGMAKAGTFQDWLLDNGEALVAALKAAQQVRYLGLSCPICGRNRLLYDPRTYTIRCEKCEADTDVLKDASDQLRDDLARVEAERNGLKRFQDFAEKEMAWFIVQAERLQARIAELEGSLRELLDEHTSDTMIPYWEGDVQHLRYGNCECSACERARSNLPAQTPSAS